jgi:hypothetical protein
MGSTNNRSSRSRSFLEIACLAASVLSGGPLAGACDADADSGSVRDGRSSGSAGLGTSSAPGRAAGAGGAPDFGRPAVLTPIDPSTVPLSSSGCLNATVLFVVDGSGSMSDEFGGVTRWDALRTALLEPTNGFIPRFHDEAEFGLMIFDGNLENPTGVPPTGVPMCSAGTSLSCPRLVRVPPVLSNLEQINKMFPIEPLGGSTPTDKAMKVAVDEMIMRATGKGSGGNPGYIILATDGQPNNICSGGSGGTGDEEKACVIAAVDRAAAANITTYVISLAGQDLALEKHLAEVAKRGNPKDPAAHTFSPMTPDDLVMTLRTVLNSALGCVI